MLVREAITTYKQTRRPDCDRMINSSRNVAELARPWVGNPLKEHFFVVLLDTKHRYICHELVSLGCLDSSIVHPREVFTLAVKLQAAAVIVIHNHPSGDPEPSAADHVVTRRLTQAGEILGIDLLDHVIITDNSHYSFRDSDEL
jgi:DNA repair protein RadC